MNKVNGKRLIGAGFALLALAATLGFSSCASTTPFVITFTTQSPLPPASVGSSYFQNISATGVTGPPTGTYTYTIIAGSFPGHGAGPNGTLAFNSVSTNGQNTTSVGQITGKPNFVATYTFTVQAVDTLKPPTVGSAEYVLTVNP